ncbi:MAG: acyl-ACP--UDP-N-acetylglucosamine O-acyltransferase [Candidatus Neomarinimicrobiota bacterium]|nr:acyl-ACP--UDP-N-acetylglucosamine O-acyltransferase [Candidatus Neomarinimicrobiota bacterium]
MGNDVKIGPFVIIEDYVSIGNGTVISANAVIKKYTKIGNYCKIFQSAVIGEIPQDLKFKGEKTELLIGDNTTIREFCTLNRGTSESNQTKIGNNVLLMAYVHVAHDCTIGNNVILANGVQLGGHVQVSDYVVIGGTTPVHQYCKIGEHAMVGGGFRVVKDVPPYILVGGEPLKYNGLNSLGLRRRGFKPEIRKILKETYKYIYNSNMNTNDAINKILLKNYCNKLEVQKIISFIKNSTRGLV